MIQPGLERIGRLLKNTQFPWKAVHVAGTNGKGSIATHTSNLLTRRIIRNGLFKSPHLVHRWDCVSINGVSVTQEEFENAESVFKNLNQEENIGASEFELLTATAFELFNRRMVEVGVVEVGMGGALDATNILNNQVVSVIAKIARDHQEFLGHSLEEIAQHKAGILRPNVPFIINPINEPNVQAVIREHAAKIRAGPEVHTYTPQLKELLFIRKEWHKIIDGREPFERDNMVLGLLAFTEVLAARGDSLKKVEKYLPALKRLQRGRLYKTSWPEVFAEKIRSVPSNGKNRYFYVDGAHNLDSAEVLQEFAYHKLRPAHKKGNIERRPVTWVVAMTDGKDAPAILKKLLRSGDNVVTTTFSPVEGMPWVKSMDPKKLLKIARSIHSSISGLAIESEGVLKALCAAKYFAGPEHPIVVTGSLYLVGDYFRLRDTDRLPDGQCLSPLLISAFDRQARIDVNSTFETKDGSEATRGTKDTSTKNDDKADDKAEIEARAKKRKESLEEEILELNRELQALEVEENRLHRARLREDTLGLKRRPAGLPSLLTSPQNAVKANDSGRKHDGFPFTAPWGRPGRGTQ